MSRLNFHARAAPIVTHEGAPAVLRLSAEQQLCRSVLSCLLRERAFYEDGQSIADRIVELAEQALQGHRRCDGGAAQPGRDRPCAAAAPVRQGLMDARRSS